MAIKERVLDMLVREGQTLADSTPTYQSVVLMGELRGSFFIIDHPSLKYILGKYEPEVTGTMRKLTHRGDVVYDIGAHAGYLSMYLSKLVGETGEVFSFEPSHHNRELLARNSLSNKLTNLVILQYAVTDTRGNVRFVTSVPSYDSHIVRNGERENTFIVPSITIDEFIASGQGLPPKLIKLDVEGEEQKVLEGAICTLKTHRPVIIAEVRKGYLKPIQDLMESKGYTWSVLSEERSLNYKMGTPNVLFLPPR